MEKCIMALDQGTTSSRCILYNKEGRLLATAQREFTQIYPQPGWVEHDPLEIWNTQLQVAQEALAKLGGTCRDIEAIGITNQRETTVIWNRHTGLPVCNAIVWQCRRTAGFCEQLAKAAMPDGRTAAEAIREKTGLLPDAYFSATKIRWILDHVDGAAKSAARGELLFGTVDTWLIWKLTGGRVHATDCTNASRTMLFNIHTLQWDADILSLLDIPSSMLPEVRPSGSFFGETDPALLGGSLPITGLAGDQQAALFGQTCFRPGDAKNTYGTGCFLLMNTGSKPIRSRNGLLTTIAWGLEGDNGGAAYTVEYALEGSVFVAGAALQWLRDELGLLESTPQSQQYAAQVPDTAGVYLVPAFTGLGAPYWDPYARGAIVGLTRGANRSHLIRAALESLAYQVCDVLTVMEEDSGIRLAALNADGGASANDFLMQFQADILSASVVRPHSVETTSLGAAYLAGLTTGYWKSKEDILRNRQIDRRFDPTMEANKKAALLSGWHKAVACARQYR